MKSSGHHSSGRRLAQNTLWNLGGNVVAIAISLVSMPFILRYLGADRLGVISLVWIIEGQFGIFDLGLSFALTKLIAEKLGSSKEEDTPSIFWCALTTMAGVGALGAVLLWIVSPSLVHETFKVPLNIQDETLSAFRLVAISLPVTISSAALRGVLAAHQRFDLLSLTRVPVSLMTYLVPLLVLPFSKSLAPFVLVLVSSRFAAWGIFLILCFRVSPVLRANFTFRNAPLGRMLKYGGWMTVTNVVGPIMVNADRLLIGAIISMSAVAYYATPYEMATKLWILPSAITGVLFPAFSATMLHDRKRVALLYEKGIKYIFLTLLPATVAIMALGGWFLEIWLGTAFAANSTIILQLLVLGVFANSLAQVPFWQIQAAGRPDWAAKVHLIELPCYVAAFWVLTRAYGITGAAVAWLLRTSVDAIIMFLLSGKLLPESRLAMRKLAWTSAAVCPLFAIPFGISNHGMALAYALTVSIGFAFVAWFLLLTEQERQVCVNPWRLLARRQLPLPDPEVEQ